MKSSAAVCGIYRAISLILSEHDAALDFWSFYSPASEPQQNFTELLFEAAFPMLVQDCKWEIRLAQIDEIEAIAKAHAEVAFIETGRDPMTTDREGFLERVARRIEMGRTFVVFDGDKLTIREAIKSREHSFQLDPGKTLKTIDIFDKQGDAAGQGIYKLDGGTLTIALAKPNSERPKEFTTKKDSSHVVIVLKREKQ